MKDDGHAGSTQSVWMASEKVLEFPQLEEDLTGVDVCIIGAGISGLCTAYMLMREGKKVALLDDGPISAGETERTTAHITTVLDTRYFELERMHGKEKVKLLAQSQQEGLQQLAYIVDEIDADCEFNYVDGYLFLAEDDKFENLEKELEAVHELGFPAASMVNRVPLGLVAPAIRFPSQAQFHVLKFINALSAAIQAGGGLIFSHEHVEKIEDGPKVRITTKSGKRVYARFLVTATSSPIFGRLRIHTKQSPYRTYVIAAKVNKSTFEEALYWDTAEPYHYLRFEEIEGDDENALLIVGGEDHRVAEENNPEERFARLEKWMRERLFVDSPIEYSWSGQINEPNDGIAFIGHDPVHGDNVFLTTGAAGVGMTHAAISAILLTDLICARENPWKELYDPARVSSANLGKQASENLNTAMQYAKLLAPGEVPSEDDIANGEGAVIRKGFKQTAVYKDEFGSTYKFSASCPHLGAKLCWNTCEKSWDCPAHGSRFSATGTVIDGPANSDLEPIEEDEDTHKKGAA